MAAEDLGDAAAVLVVAPPGEGAAAAAGGKAERAASGGAATTTSPNSTLDAVALPGEHSAGRLADYDVSKAVGKGGYSVVYKGTRKKDQRVVAIKKIEAAGRVHAAASRGQAAADADVGDRPGGQPTQMGRK
mmetsp:Transcript_33027/g.84383  ORF Transcript_33027/g.84383 Transcript_33027/m.84383 type:complete len:132 (-) Transcript_33027:61-456(-)